MKHQVPESLKFKRLCRKLSISPVVAVGTLEMLWLATQKSAPRGDIGKYTDEDIAIEVCWDGDPTELVDALVETGWLDRDEEHRLIVHDWHDHAPRYVKGIVARLGGFVSNVRSERTSATYVADVGEQQRNLTKPNLTKPNVTKPNVTKPSTVVGSAATPPNPRPSGGLEEVRAYFKHKRLKGDPERFFFYNEGRGWAGCQDWLAWAHSWSSLEKKFQGEQMAGRVDIDLTVPKTGA